MIKDIKDRDIDIGDDVVLSRGSGVFIARFIKETAKQLHFEIPSTKYPYVFYINKVGPHNRFYKV